MVYLRLSAQPATGKHLPMTVTSYLDIQLLLCSILVAESLFQVEWEEIYKGHYLTVTIVYLLRASVCD